ncbi:MAG: hypothetical protein K6E79_06950, partial [Pseudobutyrivibrio sp.]|nr:hypothetical protein [Pseudobutyrivibrio sp.]
FAAVAYAPILCIYLFRKARYLSDYAENVILTLYWLAFLVGICLVKADSVSNSRFVYACIILYFWFPYFVREREESQFTRIGAYNNDVSDTKGIMWPIFIVSTVAQLIWAVSTNQDISVPGHMTVFVVIALLLVFTDEDHEMFSLTWFILIAASFFMGFWVAEGNGGFAHVAQERWIVTDGELKGICLRPDDYQANLDVYNLVSEYVTEDDSLLVAFGSNSTGYINSDAKQGTYSVYARTQKNTKLLDYYEQHPENQADYVLIDESNSKYEDFTQGECGQYLLNTYTTEVARSGNFVLLSREGVQ